MKIFMERCKKCGNTLVTTTYEPLHDFLEKVCQKCGYRWIKQPLDKGEK